MEPFFCCWIPLHLLLRQTNSTTGIIKVSFSYLEKEKKKFKFNFSHLLRRFSRAASTFLVCRPGKKRVQLPECTRRPHTICASAVSFCTSLVSRLSHFSMSLFSNILLWWLSKVASNLVNLTPTPLPLSPPPPLVECNDGRALAPALLHG